MPLEATMHSLGALRAFWQWLLRGPNETRRVVRSGTSYSEVEYRNGELEMALRSCMLCDGPECENVFDLGVKGRHFEIVDAAEADGWTSVSRQRIYSNYCSPECEEAAA